MWAARMTSGAALSDVYPSTGGDRPLNRRRPTPQPEATDLSTGQPVEGREASRELRRHRPWTGTNAGLDPEPTRRPRAGTNEASKGVIGARLPLANADQPVEASSMKRR